MRPREGAARGGGHGARRRRRAPYAQEPRRIRGRRAVPREAGDRVGGEGQGGCKIVGATGSLKGC